MAITAESKIYTYEKDFKELVEKWEKREVIQIDEEMFYYWLGVLPPVYMNKRQVIEIDGVKLSKLCSFGFAEGREYVVDFWQAEGAYFCKMSDRLNTN